MQIKWNKCKRAHGFRMYRTPCFRCAGTGTFLDGSICYYCQGTGINPD